MNEIVVNQETGFLESANSKFTFNSHKKLEFLRLAAKIVDDAHEWPNVGDLCNAIGISVRTFNNHLLSDTKFAAEWREMELHGEATCLSDAYRLRTKNPMYMFGWLRARFPEKYDPNKKIIVQTDSANVKEALDSAKEIFEAEIVDKTSSPVDKPRLNQ